MNPRFRKPTRRGGARKSAGAKLAERRRRASQKVQKDWGGLGMPIPTTELQDQCWYYGDGGQNCVAVWDAQLGCFWTVEFESKDPPKNRATKVRCPRLKQEGHISATKGCFRPIAILENAGF